MVTRTNLNKVKVLSYLISLSLLAMLYAPSIVPAELKFYAELVKYPTIAYPEPVLAGGTLEVRIALSPKVEPKALSLTIYNELARYRLGLIRSFFSPRWKCWLALFRVPSDCIQGLYSMRLSFNATRAYSVDMPNSVWVLNRWPHFIKLLYVGDTKTPMGEPYWRELVREANLLNATMLIFNGDEVERPFMRSAWELFLKHWLRLRVPSYAGIGNHEYEEPNVAEIWESIMGYRNYTISLGKFLFIMMDTGMEGWAPLNEIKWMERVLRGNPDKVKILVMHHPLFGYKVKDEGIGVIRVNSTEDFDKLLEGGYIYSSWAEHKREAKELFKAILENDVRLVLAAHTHTDITNVVEYRGKKYYFITTTGVPYDVREGDYRDFRLITIYANSTIDVSSLLYDGRGWTDYPNGIPLDTGEGMRPYKIGYIEYYYAPSNDGSRHAVSFKARNELDQGFRNVYVCFKVPDDVPFERYRLIPKPKAYKLIHAGGYYYVTLYGVDLPAESEVAFTIASEGDTEPPTINGVKAVIDGGWLIGEVRVTDLGWGVRDVKVMYAESGGRWVEPRLYDFVESMGNGTLVFKFWVTAAKVANGTKFKVIAGDFYGNVASKDYVYVEGRGLILASSPLTPIARGRS